MPTRDQILGWELTLVIGLFGVNYGFMLNYLRNVIWITRLLDYPLDLLIFLFFTLVIYGIITLVIAIYHMYSVIDERKESAYATANAKFDHHLFGFMILIIGRILSVSWAPVGLASLTLGILQMLIPNEVVVKPDRVYAVTGESLLFFGLWLASYGVVALIEYYISHRR
jgi:hypothetical protein